jgi:hypothetical protein
MKGHTFYAAGVGAEHSGVLRVARTVTKPKISYTVIVADAVYVVKLVFRPFTVSVQPRKAVRFVQHPIYADNNVPVMIMAICHAARCVWASLHAPSNYACVRVIRH